MTIAQVSERYDISPYTLRYYEKVGLIPGVRRTGGGVRDYTDADCDWVGFIKCMRSSGLSIEVLIEYAGLFLQGDSTIEARKKILMEQRSQLILRIEGMQVTLGRLNYKIEQYEKMVIPAERKLNAGI
jgi:DNA-binding transcriptional MerR regulator